MSTPASRRELAPGRTPSAANLHAETLYQALLQSVLDPTVAIDESGTVVIASDSVERLFGRTPEELIGQNIRVIMPEPHREGHDGYLANYRETGETRILGRRREFSVLHRDGREIEIELSVSRVEMPDGSRPLFIGSFRDISDRKAAERKLEDSERRLRSVFEGSFQYIALLDNDGAVLEANQTSLDATGCTLQDVVGKPYWETRWWSLTEDASKQVKDAVERARRGELVRFETVQRGLGDEVRIVDFSIKPLRNDAGEVVLLIPEGRDISEIKRAQRAETAMLRALATIGESAAMLAHEIKNPITAVNLALRAVAHQLGEDDAAVLEDLVGRMQRLEKTMRRTLAYARPMDLDLGAVRLQALFDQVLGDLRPEFDKHAIQLEQRLEQPDLVLRADGQLLGEALTNLLKNSLEALQRGGHVVLSAESTSSSRLEIAVEDDGPGIPAEISENLFRPFVTSRHAGTGLGLAFCRKIAEEHGGSIHVERRDRGGARFVIDLPLA